MASLRTVIACTLWFVVCAQMALAQAPGAGNEERVIVKTMVGQVEIRSAGAATWRPARVGLPVRMGWDIRTYVESKAELEFESGTILRVGENSVVTLSKLMVNKGAGESNSGVKVGTGQVWANVKKLTSTKSKFDFETPTAVASIRGTRLGINVGKEGTAIEVYEGRVMVRNKGAAKEFPIDANVRAIIKQGSTGVDLAKFTEKEVAGADVFKDAIKADSTKQADSTAAASDSTKKADSTVAPVDTSKKSDTTAVKPDTTKKTDTIAVKPALAPKPDTTVAKVDSIKAPLILTVDAPVDGQLVKEKSIRVSGKTTPGATVTVNGRAVVVTAQGTISTDVAVSERDSGELSIDVVASNGSKSMSVSRKVSIVKATAAITTPALSLQLVTPREGSIIATPQIPVNGKTAPGAKVTVNGSNVAVTPTGTFVTMVPIPDEPQDYTVNVTATLGVQQMDQRITVTYQPVRVPLTLTIATPVDGQLIKDKTIRVTGKTSPGAAVTINGRTATVTPQGIISSDILVTEQNIGDYTLDIAASDGTKDLSITRTVVIDANSPLINTNAPMITVTGLNQSATRTGQVIVNVSDRTLDDVITLEVVMNSTKQEYTMSSGDKQTIVLDPGKDQLAIRAYDKARNASNVVTGSIYYLPGPLTIRITDPSNNPMIFNGVPPMPRNVRAPSIPIRIELDDRISNVPESIQFCKITGNGQSILLRDNKDYSFTGEISVNPGSNMFTVQAQDFAGNLATKMLTIIINR